MRGGLSCRLEASAGFPVASTQPAHPRSFTSGLITGGTGSLGCLVARWLTQCQPASQSTAMPSSPPAAQPGSDTAGQPSPSSANQDEAVQPTPAGIAVVLLGRSGRADAVVGLLLSARQLQSLITVRQCDASCREDMAAMLQQGCQVGVACRHECFGAHACCVHGSRPQQHKTNTLSLWPLQGTSQAFFHAAGSLSDALVTSQTASRVRQVFAAKVSLFHHYAIVKYFSTRFASTLVVPPNLLVHILSSPVCFAEMVLGRALLASPACLTFWSRAVHSAQSSHGAKQCWQHVGCYS